MFLQRTHTQLCIKSKCRHPHKKRRATTHKGYTVKQQIHTAKATLSDGQKEFKKNKSTKGWLLAYRDHIAAYTELDHSGLNPLVLTLLETHSRSQISSGRPKNIVRHGKLHELFFSHLRKIFLAPIHDILWGQTVDHVAGVENNQQQNHAEEEEGLGTCSLWSYFVQLRRKTQECAVHCLFWWKQLYQNF